jgi:hypothetical protein
MDGAAGGAAAGWFFTAKNAWNTPHRLPFTLFGQPSAHFAHFMHVFDIRIRPMDTGFRSISATDVTDDTDSIPGLWYLSVPSVQFVAGCFLWMVSVPVFLYFLFSCLAVLNTGLLSSHSHPEDCVQSGSLTTSSISTCRSGPARACTPTPVTQGWAPSNVARNGGMTSSSRSGVRSTT